MQTHTDDLYHEQLLEEFAHPQHHGVLESFTHQAQNGNASCGDSIHVTVLVQQEKVTDVGWEGQGCAISTAAMSALSDTIIGKTRAEIEALSREDVQALLGLETLAIARHSCAEVGLKAVKQALASTTK